jgi:hypothetical protein
MFASPPAKRIRRSEVFDSPGTNSTTSSSDEEVTETTNIKEIQENIGLTYHFDYDLIENAGGRVTKFAHLQVDGTKPEAKDESIPNQEAPPGDNAFEFRLFSTRPLTPTEAGVDAKSDQKLASTRINIRSPTPDEPSDGRFLNPHRPQGYYFASDTELPSFASSAVSSLGILNSSHDPWPGAAVPWRVIHLCSSSTKDRTRASRVKSNSISYPTLNTSSSLQSRRKPSKKRRIQLRTRTKLLDARAKEKEEHLREKKTRLNRERKVKRREKEKAEKEMAKARMMWEGGVEGER